MTSTVIIVAVLSFLGGFVLGSPMERFIKDKEQNDDRTAATYEPLDNDPPPVR